MKKIFVVLFFIFLMVSVLPVSAQTSNWNNLSVEEYKNFIYYCGKSYGFNFKMGEPTMVVPVDEDKENVSFYQLSNDDFVVFNTTYYSNKITSIKTMSYIPTLLYTFRGRAAKPKSFNALLQCTVKYICPEITDKQYEEWYSHLYSKVNEGTFYYKYGFTAMRAVIYESDTYSYLTQVLLLSGKR